MTSIKTTPKKLYEQSGARAKSSLNMGGYGIRRIAPGDSAGEAVGLDSNSLITATLLGTGTPSATTLLIGTRVWMAMSAITIGNADMLDSLHAAAFGLVNAQVWGDLQGYMPLPYIKYDTAWISQLTTTGKNYLRSAATETSYLQSFTAPDLLNDLITSISLKLSHVGTITTGKKVWLEVYAYNTTPSGPTGDILGASAAIYVDEIAAAEAVYKFAFNRAVTLQLTTINTEAYCFVLKGNYDVDANNHIGVGSATTTPYPGGEMRRTTDEITWNAMGSTEDMYFSINVGYNGSNIKLDAVNAGAGYLPIANLPLSIPDRKFAQITTANKVALGAIVPATASKALQSSASGIIEASTVTATELGYVSGVTSAIQTQMNLKAPLISPAFTTPNIGVASGTSLTLSGLTASIPVVTGADKILASMTYATFKTNLVLAQADVSGLTTASSPVFTGETLSGLTVAGIVTNTAAGLLATAPYAIKTLTGTTNAAEGGVTDIAHGLDASKILSVSVLVAYGTNLYIPNSYVHDAEYEFTWASSGTTNIRVLNSATNSANILSKPIKVIIIYTP